MYYLKKTQTVQKKNLPNLMRNNNLTLNRLLHSFFESLYTDLSWAYDAVAWLSSMGQWRSWQRTGLDVLPPGRSLEIGFGTGHMIEERASKGFFVAGVDISPQMTRIARKRHHKSDHSILIAQASGLQLPFPNTVFTSVLSTFPSEYIFKNETLEEIERVLIPGGKMVIIPGVQKITGPGSRGKILLRLLDKISALLYSLTGQETRPDTDWKENLIEKLESIGFSTSIENVRLERSIVLRIVAQKVDPSS